MKIYIIICLIAVSVVMLGVTINNTIRHIESPDTESIGEIISASLVFLAYLCATIFAFLLK